MADDSTDKLHEGLAKSKCHADAVLDARRQLVHKATQQLDSLQQPLKEWGAAVQSGRGGGHLAAMRHRNLLDERQRLEAVIAKHGHVLHDSGE